MNCFEAPIPDQGVIGVSVTEYLFSGSISSDLLEVKLLLEWEDSDQWFGTFHHHHRSADLFAKANRRYRIGRKHAKNAILAMSLVL